MSLSSSFFHLFSWYSAGNGVKVWPDGKQVYSGTFLKGHMHGHGEMTYSDGSQVSVGVCKPNL